MIWYHTTTKRWYISHILQFYSWYDISRAPSNNHKGTKYYLFAEYNKARQEAKGGITAQSNFIQNDINRLVTLFRTCRDNAMIRSADYYEVIDPLFALIEMTGGRRDLPEGKNFGDVFIDVKKIAREKVQKWEEAWKLVYEPFMKHFAEEIQKMQGKNPVEA